MPTADEILEFVNSQDGKVGKREIARAFNIKGAKRIELKRILREMTADGLLNRKSRSFRPPGSMPPVSLLDIVRIDDNGEPVGRPPNWDEDTDGPAPYVVVETKRRSSADTAPGVGDRVLARIAANPDEDEDYPYRGTVIRKLNRDSTIVLGVLRKTDRAAWRVSPVDRRARDEIEIAAADLGGAQPGEMVSVELMGKRGRGLPRGRIRERFDSVDDPRSVSLIAVHAHGIPHRFPDDVLAETDRLREADPDGRRDIRDIPLITIDPADARDHDDAVWAEPDDDPDNAGGHRVIVAIADVSAYVRPGTALDREAFNRGNSVYFPDRVVPMLPERISNDLCSLRAHEDRPALAVTMIFDADGNKTGHEFSRVLMRSAAKLSYVQAQAAIDGTTDDVTEPLLEPVLKPLWSAYRAVKKARDRREPLELDLPERKIVLDEAGHIENIHTPERLDAHKLIEEFMIQANVSAAETLTQRKSPLLYRVHEPPSEEKLRALSEFLTTLDIKVGRKNAVKPKDFNDVLHRVRDHEVEQLVSDVILRSQSQAVYDPENLGHFGLNLRRYAHFTSPIRRYADLIVHRSLIKTLKFGKDGLDDATASKLKAVGEHISGTERRAMLAERETVDRLVATYLSDKVGAQFHGRLSGVVRAGLFVRLTDTGADGFIPAASLTQDYFVHDEKTHALVGRHTGETFRLGDPVEVRLLEVTPISGGLRFELLSDGRAGKPVKTSRHHHGYRRPGRRGRAKR